MDQPQYMKAIFFSVIVFRYKGTADAQNSYYRALGNSLLSRIPRKRSNNREKLYIEMDLMVQRHFSLQTLLRQHEGCETSDCVVRVCLEKTRSALQAQSGPFRPVGSSYRLFLGGRRKVNAFSGRRRRNTVRSRFKNVTAVSTESVASQIQNLHKRDTVCDSPFLSKNKT